MNSIDSEHFVLEWGSEKVDGSVVEMNLLLEPWLLAALERTAEQQGMTTAALARRLLRDFLYYSDGSFSEP
jgi:hypothetical protein